MYSTPRLPAATGVLTGLTLCFLRSLFPLAAMGPSSDFRQVWNWVKTHDWRKTGRNAVRRKYWAWWILLVGLIVASVVLSLYQDPIVAFVEPYKEAILEFPGSWAVAIFLLIIFAIPPLVGHLILVITIGLVWGFWIGSILTMSGSILGEWLVFVAVRYSFSEGARRMEESNLTYACVAQLLRQGGLWVNLFVRVSFMSGHVVTILQAIAGTPTWIFVAAQLPEAPRQCSTVYMGVVFGQTSSEAKIISIVLYAFTLFISVLAAIVLSLRVGEIYPILKSDMARRGHAGDEFPDGLEEDSEADVESDGRERRPLAIPPARKVAAKGPGDSSGSETEPMGVERGPSVRPPLAKLGKPPLPASEESSGWSVSEGESQVLYSSDVESLVASVECAPSRRLGGVAVLKSA